jgi:spermidine/putrescine transport system ATP-binding protein/putrescine transport system ATP-binding protein
MNAEHGPLVRIDSISRSFGDVVALDSVSMEIHENEFFALLGPSGCGKTTLLRVLAGFAEPDSGTVTLGGQDLLALPPNKRPINLMFQSYALFPHMSVEKNVAYGLEREGRPKDEVRDRVAEVLTTVGLTDKARTRPAQLSGGQRQRVALARAIVKRPRLLLLDEPLSALDRKVRSEMQLELKRLQHEVGITFVVVTHDQEEAMSMADRIAVMSEGRVQQIDTPVDLYQRPRTMFVADFIGSSNTFAGTRVGGGVDVAGLGVLPGHAPHEVAAGPATLIVRPEDAELVGPDQAILSGTVMDIQFYGGSSTIAVGIDGHDVPVIVTRPGATDVHRGTAVHLAWSSQKAVVLGAEP